MRGGIAARGGLRGSQVVSCFLYIFVAVCNMSTHVLTKPTTGSLNCGELGSSNLAAFIS